MSESNKELREIFYNNEYYSINNSKNILWLCADEDPDKEAHPNGGFEYRVIETDDIDLKEYISDIEQDGGDSVFWSIIEKRTTNYGYINCNEEGNAFIEQIEGIDIGEYLCAYDSSYAIDGYIAALHKIGEIELSNVLSDIVREEVELDEIDFGDDFTKFISQMMDADWNVNIDGDSVEFSQSSPAGEDFSFSIQHHNGDMREVYKEVSEYYQGFDVEDHVKMWLEAKSNGVSGVPGVVELVEDAKEIDEMLKQATDIAYEIRFSEKEPSLADQIQQANSEKQEPPSNESNTKQQELF